MDNIVNLIVNGMNVSADVIVVIRFALVFVVVDSIVTLGCNMLRGALYK